MNAVIYARFSSENQREESIDGQLRECTAYAEKNGMTVIDSYIDRAFSAKTDQRPDFQRMIRDSAKGKFDIVLVWKLDRFARNRYDSAHYKNQLKKNGVRVISATENIADGPDGILLESVLEGMAEYYSAELSEKVIRGMTENALKCKCNGGKMSFGLKNVDGHFQIDPDTAPVVLRIFELYDSGMSMTEITTYIRDLGVKTSAGHSPDKNFVNRILVNRRYVGEYKYRDIIHPHGIPAIVPEDLFERVQEKIKINKKAPARHKAQDDYILTTKLFCGSCKCFMVGESGTSKSGIVYRYYRCVNSKRNCTCTAKHKTVKKTALEKAVLRHVKMRLMDDDFVEAFAKMAFDSQERESAELTALRAALAQTEKKIENMIRALEQGVITESTTNRLKALEREKVELETQTAQFELQTPVFSYDEIKYYILSFRDVDLDLLSGRKSLVNHFVKSVIVNDDKIIVTLNYNKRETTFSFDDLENEEACSDFSSETQPKKDPDFDKKSGSFLFVPRQSSGPFIYRSFFHLQTIASSNKARITQLFSGLCCILILKMYRSGLSSNDSPFLQKLSFDNRRLSFKDKNRKDSMSLSFPYG